MPYISTERVKEIRQEIKAAFPGWKFSITKDSSTVRVAIFSGPLKMMDADNERGYECVNPYYIKDHYKDNAPAMDMLLKLFQIMNKGNGVLVEDGDYGTVPHFYTDIRVGDWDKAYVQTETKQQITQTEAIALPTEPTQAGAVNIIDYSEKAIAVIGNTKPIKELLKEAGGRFNKYLSCGAGWIFPKTKLENLKTILTTTANV